MLRHTFWVVALVVTAAQAEAQQQGGSRPDRGDPPATASPNATVYQYDAIGRRLVDARPAPVSRAIQVNITGLNPLCYDVERVTYTIKQVEVPAATAFLTLIGYPATTTPPKEPPKAPASTDSSVKSLVEALTGEFRLLRDSEVESRGAVRKASAAASERAFAAIEAAIRLARIRLGRAESMFSPLQVAKHGAERLVEEVKGGGVCGTNVPLEAFITRWEHDLPGVRQALGNGGDAAFATARSEQAAAAAMLTALDDALKAFAADDSPHHAWSVANQLRVSTGKGTISALKSRSDAISTQLTAYADRLPGLLSDLSESAALVSGARLAASQVVIVPVNDETERVDFTMRRVGRKGITGIEGKVIEDSWSIPVQRRFRFFLSAGFLVSRFRSVDFERRLRPSAENTDSTYSTYIDVAGGTGTAIAPTIQANITVGPVLALSAGASSRTVNKKVGLDFLLGGSLAFTDRFLLTLGWSYTRVERLLLPGTAAEVAAKPVPANITDEAAVGEKRVLAPMIGVTFRIN